MVKIALIDNHDSFTYNLYQLFDENKHCKIEVHQNDKVQIEQLAEYDKIVLSPGPDIPRAYPLLFDVLQEYSQIKSILGVCLGHQTIVEFFGGRLINLPKVFHGIKEVINIDNTDTLFKGLPDTVEVGLYHSWCADKEHLPDCFKITATSLNTSIIMGGSHKNLDVKGIQFHPESYMTKHGRDIINNWVSA